MPGLRATLAIPVTPEEDQAFDELAERIAARLAPKLAAVLDERPMLTIPAAAERLGISKTKCYALIRDGNLRTVPIGKQQRVEQTELDRFVRERR